MKPFTCLLLALLAPAIYAADIPPEWIEAGEKRRTEIPLGGDFEPNPKTPAFVAVGHGARILLSRDDGKTWNEVFWGYPGSDHGGWATNAVAYTQGVFGVPVGWVNPTSYLASEDGMNWRHLTKGDVNLSRKYDDPSVMPTAMSMTGGKGVFVASGYMTISVTPDFGTTWTTFSLRSLKNDPRRRKLVTHHVKTIYCGNESGRFLTIGNDRSKVNPVFGNLFASDDLGKTWTWLEPKILNEKCQGYSGMVSNGRLVLIADKSGENVFASDNAGESWEGPFPTGTQRGTLSMVNHEFWLTSDVSRASADGETWRDVPNAVPVGKIASSPDGTLISIDRKRFNILRSADEGESWEEVYRFEPPKTDYIHGAQGLRDIQFGYLSPEPDSD